MSDIYDEDEDQVIDETWEVYCRYVHDDRGGVVDVEHIVDSYGFDEREQAEQLR